MGELTDADRWLQQYADDHGYGAEFEPDWTARFGREFATNPDFRLERAGAEAVVESRGFESWALSEFMGNRSGGGVIPPGVTLRPIYYAFKEKAEQLQPFAVAGEPLVIALANTGSSDVMLDDHHLRSAMFGDLAVSVPIAGAPGVNDADLPPPQMVVQPGYGAFCATEPNGVPVNPRPHVSGVAVVSRHDLADEFREADLRQLIEDRAPETHEQRKQVVVEWLDTPVAQGRVETPTGYEYGVAYYDLRGYGLGHGVPVPEDWFNGPRDRRFAFDATGTAFSLVRGNVQLD